MTTVVEIAKGLSTEEWAALEYIQTNGSYLINDEDNSLNNFDRVFLKGLLNKIYNQDSPRYFLNVYGRAVLEARASAPVAGKPATVTAKEFVEQGYAEKVARGECIISVTDDPDKSTPIENVLQNPDGSYTAFYGITDAHNWSMWKDVKSLDVTWLPAPQPATAQAANETVAGSGADTAEMYVDNIGLVLASSLSRAIDDLGHNNYPENEQQCNIAFQSYHDYVVQLQAAIASLKQALTASETELSALSDQNVRLRALCEKAANAIGGLDLPTWKRVEPLVDDLRQAANREGSE